MVQKLLIINAINLSGIFMDLIHIETTYGQFENNTWNMLILYCVSTVNVENANFVLYFQLLKFVNSKQLESLSLSLSLYLFPTWQEDSHRVSNS